MKQILFYSEIAEMVRISKKYLEIYNKQTDEPGKNPFLVDLQDLDSYLWKDIDGREFHRRLKFFDFHEERFDDFFGMCLFDVCSLFVDANNQIEELIDIVPKEDLKDIYYKELDACIDTLMKTKEYEERQSYIVWYYRRPEPDPDDDFNDEDYEIPIVDADELCNFDED